MKYNAILPSKPLLCAGAAFFLAATAAYTQFSPDVFLVADAPGSIRGLVTADFNADGRDDLLAISDKYLFWVENAPADSLGYYRHYPIQARTLAPGYPLIAIADMDGDGDADILASDSTTAWIPNSGLGQFSQSANPVTGPAEQLAAADIDGDNDMDVVTVQDGKIKWYKNLNGKGTAFSTGIEAEDVGPFYNFMRVLDIDSDGDQDLVFNLYTGGFVTLEWRENTDGKGAWSARKQLHNQFVSELTQADMDADGRIDLVGIFQPQGVGWLRNTGTGYEQVQWLGGANQFLQHLDVADVDNDDLPDLVAGSPDALWLFRNYGVGLVVPIKVLEAKSFLEAVFSDTDKDGDPDIVAMNAETGEMIRISNTGGGLFGFPVAFNVWARSLRRLATADIDGDGDLDVVGACSQYDDVPSRLTWYVNENGLFRREKFISDQQSFIADLECADLDGDNDPDVLVTDLNSGGTSWYQNLDVQGHFGPIRPISAQAEPFTAFTADIDLDGDRDVIVGAQEDFNVALYKNMDGKGNFGAIQTLLVNIDDPRAVAVLNLDGNQVPDLAVAYYSGTYKVKFYLASAPGVFNTPPLEKGSLELPIEFETGDLDKDGRPDLVAMGQNQIAVYRSSTGFSRSTVGQFENGSDLTIGDFDNDGNLDLVAATTSDTMRVLLFTNTDGLGQFDTGARIDDARANGVAAADADGDGDTDLFIGEENGRIFWRKNNFPIASVEQHSAEKIIRIFPNPVTDQLNLRWANGRVPVPGFLEVFDPLGRAAGCYRLTGLDTQPVPVSDLPPGIYWYQITFEKGGRVAAAGKLVKY